MGANQIQPVPYNNTRVVASMIVPEVLREDNYESWRIFMQHYLVAQDLWDVVLSNDMLHEEDSREWIKRNALALHTIKISCGAKKFDGIKEMNSAKDAWNALANLHKQPNEDASRGSETNTEVKETWTRILDNDKRSKIMSSLYDGDWDALKILDGITEIIFPGGFTILHIATILGHLKIVNELVKITREDYLEDYLKKQDDNGDTALSLAAFNGEVKIAECLIEKHDKLLKIQNKEGYIPLVVACINKQEDMTSYLYSKTGFEFLFPENSNQGPLFLKYCALNFMLDVGLDLYLRCPGLAAEQDSITILELSAQPARFRSRTPPPLIVEQFLPQRLDVIEFPSPSDDPVNARELETFKRQVAKLETEPNMNLVLWFLIKLEPLLKNGILGLLYCRPISDGQMRRMYKVELTHTYANLVLRHWCKVISTYKDATKLVESGAIKVIFQAIKDGTNEIVIEILKANPDLIWCNEKLSRDIIIFAISYRRGDILKFVCSLDVGKKAFLFLRDKDENNVLHLVAKLSDGSLIDDGDIQHAVLMLNREEKFFQEIKSCLPRWCHEAENRYGETPGQVFRKEHHKLAKEVEEWGKKTAKSYSLASVLIVTIMFAALFTVPGGFDEKTGMPILLNRTLFSGFLMCDAVSFATGSMSLLGFLTIFTSYRSRGLPLRDLLRCMTASILTLFISVLTMIAAFTCALSLFIDEKWGLVVTFFSYPVVTFIYALLVWQLSSVIWLPRETRDESFAFFNFLKNV